MFDYFTRGLIILLGFDSFKTLTLSRWRLQITRVNGEERAPFTFPAVLGNAGSSNLKKGRTSAVYVAVSLDLT